MKLFRSKRGIAAGQANSAPAPAVALGRRGIMAGTAAAGAAAVAAQVFRQADAPVQPVVDVAAATQKPSDGYQLTQHVLRYYETAKV